MDKDVFKLDTRVTTLFSKAQVDVLRDIARREQTSVSGLVRKWVVDKLRSHYLDLYRTNQALARKETQDG